MALPPRSMGPMVDRPAGMDELDPELQLEEVAVDEPMDFSGGAEITEGDDGSAVLRALVEEAEASGMGEELIEHDANLAEYLQDDVLGALASELVGNYEEDLESRSEWETAYVKGLDLLGVKHEERSEPFEGASAVTHPLISESVTQFQAQAYKELLPAGGPVKTRIIGAQTPEVEDQSERVKHHMNYLITEEMEEYDPEMDQMLFYLPLSGSTFKKTYFDPLLQRPVSNFVQAQDIVVPYTATDLRTAPRITHVLKMTDNEIRKYQALEVYVDADLGPSGDADTDDVTEKTDELQGVSSSGYTDDTRTLLEVHVELDLEGFEDKDPDGEPSGIKLPYIVTVDKDSSTVLSIRRNYREGDSLRRPVPYFTHYKFLPGLGFYGFGLLHMIGGIGKAATSILRQLIDAGTLSNLPGGFKARGVRVRNSDDPIQPGEWRDMDAPGGVLRDSIMPLPYKEPSATLANLLGALIDAGRRFVSIADQQVSNMNQEMPVGTTVAMLERGMKVMSAIHKRLHYAQKQEFRILARVVAEETLPAYPYMVEGGQPGVKAADFDGRIDIVPVSDPNIFSMAQRVALAQEQLKLAQTNPQMHNLHSAYKRMYQALEVQNIDEILPPPPQPQPTDPAMENSALLMGQPAQAFPQQNHDAHIKAHVALMMTSLIQDNPQALAMFYSHVQQHISFEAQRQAQEQIQQAMQQVQALAQVGAVDQGLATQQLQQAQAAAQDPTEYQNYVALIQQQLLEKYMPQMRPPEPDPMADPLVQIRQQELATKQQENEADARVEQAKLELERAKMAQKAAAEAARIELQEEIADERNAVNRERIEAQTQNRGG